MQRIPQINALHKSIPSDCPLFFFSLQHNHYGVTKDDTSATFHLPLLLPYIVVVSNRRVYGPAFGFTLSSCAGNDTPLWQALHATIGPIL
jgi:hypothetical protein